MTYVRFTVDQIRCLDCNRTFEISRDNVSASKLETSNPTACVLVFVPKQCPECRNIRPVPL